MTFESGCEEEGRGKSEQIGGGIVSSVLEHRGHRVGGSGCDTVKAPVSPCHIVGRTKTLPGQVQRAYVTFGLNSRKLKPLGAYVL